MKKFRVGVVGCGGIAKGSHFPSYLLEKRVEIVGLCDIRGTFSSPSSRRTPPRSQ